MNPVQSLQHMLRHLSRTVSTLPGNAETGVFDEPTLEAVIVFQRDYGLPVTGIVDQATWDKITAAYYLNLFQTGMPPDLRVLPHGSTVIRDGEYNPPILIVQGMMSALNNSVSNFQRVEQNGQNSAQTLHNLKTLQQLAGLPITGHLDRATWSMISHLYRILITRRPHGTSPL